MISDTLGKAGVSESKRVDNTDSDRDLLKRKRETDQIMLTNACMKRAKSAEIAEARCWYTFNECLKVKEECVNAYKDQQDKQELNSAFFSNSPPLNDFYHNLKPKMPKFTSANMESFLNNFFSEFRYTLLQEINQCIEIVAKAAELERPIKLSNSVNKEYISLIMNLSARATQNYMMNRMIRMTPMAPTTYCYRECIEFKPPDKQGAALAHKEAVKYNVQRQLGEGIIDPQELFRYGCSEYPFHCEVTSPSMKDRVKAIKGGYVVLYNFMINIAVCSRKMAAATAHAVEISSSYEDMTYHFKKRFLEL